MIKRLYKKIVPEKERIKWRLAVQKLGAFFYAGDNYACNCCRKTFSKFLPKGNVKRLNAKCPNCSSLERTRLLLFYLQEETQIFTKGKKVLHFAPEEALKKVFIQHETVYVDGDINPAYASQVIDITAIPFPDDFFDYIVCSHVLGHVPNELQAIEEMKRVLKPSGEALVMTLLDLNTMSTFEDENIATPEAKLNAYGEADLCRLHGLDFSDRLTQGGFKVKQIDYRKTLTPKVCSRYSLGNGEREMIFKCTIIV